MMRKKAIRNMLNHKRTKALTVGAIAFASAMVFSAHISHSASAEAFGANQRFDGKYSFSPQFTKASQLTTWGQYSNNWSRSNVTETGNVGGVMGDAVGYGSGGYAKTLTADARMGGAGSKVYNGTGGVIYTNVGINPKTGRMLDLKITILGTEDDRTFNFDYRKLSFSEASISFASTGYKNVRLNYRLVDHGTNNTANLQGITLNFGDVNIGQTVTVASNQYGNLAAGSVSNGSIVHRRDENGGVKYWTNIERGSREQTSLSLAFNGAFADVAYGKDYEMLYDTAKITIGGVTKTYREWMNYYGNPNGIYRMRIDSAAAEYMDLSGSPTQNYLYSPDFQKRILQNGQEVVEWKSSSTNPYADTIKYKLTTGVNPPVGSNNGGKLTFVDTVGDAVRYVAQPTITAHRPDGSTANVTGDFNYSLTNDGSKFTLQAKDDNYVRNNPGTYYTIEYSGQVKDSKNAALGGTDGSGYVNINNTATATWNGSTMTGTAKYGFKPTFGSATKTVTVNGQTASTNSPALHVRADQAFDAVYTLSAHIGSAVSGNKTMNSFSIEDEIPAIFNVPTSGGVTVWSGGKDVTNDFNISQTRNAASKTAVKVTPKDARKYYGTDVQVKVTAKFAGFGQTLIDNNGGMTAGAGFIDGYMTDTNRAELSNNGRTDVGVYNTFLLNEPGQPSITSNKVTLNYTKYRAFINPTMAGTNQAPRLSNDDSNVAKGLTVDGYEGTRLDTSMFYLKDLPGWTSLTGSNSPKADLRFESPNRKVYVDYKKHQLTISGGKLTLETAEANNNAATTVSISRNAMWSGYSISKDADLKNAKVVIALKDSDGNLLQSHRVPLSDVLVANSEKTTTNAGGTVDVKATLNLAGPLYTARAKYLNNAQPGASTSAAVKNIKVAVSIDMSGDNSFKLYDAGSTASDAKYKDVSNANQFVRLHGNDSTSDVGRMRRAPLVSNLNVIDTIATSPHQDEVVRVLSQYTNGTGTGNGVNWVRVLTHDGTIAWVDKNVTTPVSNGPVNKISNFGNRDINGENLDITWENATTVGPNNGDGQRAWTPTKQTLTFNDLASIQSKADKHGMTKIGGWYELKGIQASVSDLANGQTTNKMETATVSDDALDFDISAGYGFANTIKMGYEGYRLGNSSTIDTRINKLTTPKDQSADMVGSGTVGVTTGADNKTVFQNPYAVQKATTYANSGETDWHALNISKEKQDFTFSLKQSYLDQNTSKVYFSNATALRKNAGNKIYTSERTKLDNPGQFHTNSVDLASNVGANKFKIAYDKHVSVSSPMILTGADKTHNADAELAFQPVFDGFKPSGFTARQNDWLKN